MIAAADPNPIRVRYKAITAFFPYVARQERDGRNEMLDTFLHAAMASKKQGFMWHRIGQPAVALLNEGNPVSLKRAVVLASSHLPWWNTTIDGRFIQLWAAAAWAVPYTHDLGHSVVDTLLLIASQDSLRSHIPVKMWSWLNRCPALPPACMGGSQGSKRNVVQTVRRLEDVEILTSYLLIVWSEWVYLYPDGLDEMCASIKQDFHGIGMGYYRKDLLRHLNRVLGELDLGLGYIQQRKQGLGEDDIQSMKGQYGRLKEVLLKVEEEVISMLIREPLDLLSSSVC